MELRELYAKTAELCAGLIRARSYSGEEAGAAAVLRSALEGLGYEVCVDRYGSVLGCIRGKRPGPRVLLDGHLDTVPVDEPARWQHDPFGAEVENGRMYGRGTSDMKGALAAMACAGAYYAENCSRAFPGEIWVAGVVYEELFEGIAAREVSKRARPDFVVIGEATALNLKIGQRGRAEVALETAGIPAHSANPEKGVNAVKKMMALLAEIEKLAPGEQPELGRGILEVTDIISHPYPGASVVPDRCVATLDRRLLTGETPERVLAPLEEIIGKLKERDHAFSAKAYLRAETKTCYTGSEISAERFFPAWLFHREEPFVKNAYESLRGVGLAPEIATYSFCTNGSHYAGEAGIRTLGFGPSEETLAHTVDEYIEIDQLEKAARGYVALIGALLHTA